MNRIAEHVWADGKCLHCGLTTDKSDKSCIFRDAPPRPVPTSIFADLGEIGDLMKKIQAEEGQARAGASE